MSAVGSSADLRMHKVGDSARHSVFECRSHYSHQLDASRGQLLFLGPRARGAGASSVARYGQPRHEGIVSLRKDARSRCCSLKTDVRTLGHRCRARAVAFLSLAARAGFGGQLAGSVQGSSSSSRPGGAIPRLTFTQTPRTRGNSGEARSRAKQMRARAQPTTAVHEGWQGGIGFAWLSQARPKPACQIAAPVLLAAKRPTLSAREA